MRCAVIVFPGSNCDRDLGHALSFLPNCEVDYVSCDQETLEGYDAAFLPGGFSYGDYLRTGALAAFTPIVTALREFADSGKFVCGICNGFQILTEIGLLPGALIKNTSLSFICKTTPLKVANAHTAFTNHYQEGQTIHLPIAHMEGNYYCDQATLEKLQKNNQIVFTYEENPNGSIENIAGIVNESGNVLGMMPHPERAVESLLGNEDGVAFFTSLAQSIQEGGLI